MRGNQASEPAGKGDDVVDALDEPRHAETESAEPSSRLWSARWAMWLLEHAQDLVSVLVGTVLVLVSAVLLIAGVVDFVSGTTGHESVLSAANTLLDRVLLVLILVEIVHTVVLSLRAHTLVPQPFIVVGLVAVLRKILFILSSPNRIDTSEVALLIAMVAVFVASLIAINLFGGSPKPGERSPQR